MDGVGLRLLLRWLLMLFFLVCVCCVVRVRSRVLYIPRNNFLLKK